MRTDDQLLEDSDSGSITHASAAQSLNVQVLGVARRCNGKLPSLEADCELTFPMTVSPLGVTVPDAEHVELVQRFELDRARVASVGMRAQMDAKCVGPAGAGANSHFVVDMSAFDCRRCRIG